MDDILNDIATVQQIDAIRPILTVVCDSSGMGFAAVARVTGTQWVACEVLDTIGFGLAAGGELPVETTICSEVRLSRAEVVIDDVAADPAFCAHPTPAMYDFRSYISVPIVLAGGEVFGTLCALDRQPHALKGSSVVRLFRLFAELIAFHLDANQKLTDSATDLESANAEADNAKHDLATSEARLTDAQATAELREQFIAVLGHDLRNPLAGLEGGRRILSGMHTDPKSARILTLMGESVSRMSGLIDNVMDFARGRLGGGIGLTRSSGERIEPLLEQVVNEIRTAHPERAVDVRVRVAEPVDVDQARIAQMLSNLLGNAVAHGAEDKPIIIDAWVDERVFHLAVANGGEPIPPAAMERLFQPFYRGEVRPSMQGLGLGLYIASQIAEAHGGDLAVTSTIDETRFTFRMPMS